jgi:hypothetical protein
MYELKNNTKREITSSTGHVIPANGILTVSKDTLSQLQGEPYIAGQLLRANLTVEAPATAEPEALITRSDIAKARKSELIEMLWAHGVDQDGLNDKTADDLREKLAAIMFVDA